MERCCFCAPDSERCGTDGCPCVAAQRTCLDRCESEKYRSNCLNQVITRCSCMRVVNMPKAKPEIIFCNTGRCECHRYREGCTAECLCKGDCLNSISAILWQAPRPDLPASLGCKCSGKKACTKYVKCSCMQALSFCSFLCKCNANCNNATTNPIPAKARLIFNNPDSEQMAIIAKLSGNTGYAYRMVYSTEEKSHLHPIELFSDAIHSSISQYNIPINQIVLYASRSPCFHQDCEPRCEVLEQCLSQRACARRLKGLLRQVQRQLGDANVSLSVKFFSPYVRRGDLYTRHGIVCLMEGGILVEPLTLKDWGEVMHENDPLPQPPAAQISLWAAANMDRYVRASQHYINSCRRVTGASEGLWTSPFHDMLRSAILTFGITQHRLDKLSKQLEEVGEINYFGSQTDIYSSALNIDRGEGRSRPQHRNTPESMRDKFSKRSKSFHGSEYDQQLRSTRVCMSPEPASVTDPSDPVSTTQSSYHPASGTPTVLTPHSHPNLQNGPVRQEDGISTERQSETASASVGSDQAKQLELMLLNFSSKNIRMEERDEIYDEISASVGKIQRQIAALVQYLEEKSNPQTQCEVKV